MNIDKLLARITAQTPSMIHSGSGGEPELTAADISVIASHAPHIAFDVLMVKCCQDGVSLKRLFLWLHNFSLDEWFFRGRKRNENTSVKIGHVNRLVELAIIGWYSPRSEEYKNVLSMSKYIKTNHGTFKKRYHGHLDYLVMELDYQEKVARMAVREFLQ